MAEHTDRIAEVRPKIRQRACGGWIAICPRAAGLSFGVTAPTESEAADRFRFEFSRWLDILDQKVLYVPK
jgi:hypothetical protein